MKSTAKPLSSAWLVARWPKHSRSCVDGSSGVSDAASSVSPAALSTARTPPTAQEKSPLNCAAYVLVPPLSRSFKYRSPMPLKTPAGLRRVTSGHGAFIASSASDPAGNCACSRARAPWMRPDSDATAIATGNAVRPKDDWKSA